jgi:hypothetical protein
VRSRLLFDNADKVPTAFWEVDQLSDA